MKISVIIPTHNRSDALEQTLIRLSHQRFNGKWETIIVNNNSTDNTNEVVAMQHFPVALHLIEEKKPGAAAARNAGARVAKGKYLIFIDNDILVETDFLQQHWRSLQENPGCWIVGLITNLPEQEKSALGIFRKSLYISEPTNEVSEIMYFTAANCSMPSEDFKRLGGFDPNFYVASGEDRELAIRARKELRIRVLYVPNIVSLHNDWAGWTFKDFCLRQRLYAQTEFLFWQKYGDETPRLQLAQEGLPIDWWKDSLRLKVRKLTKQLLSNIISQFVLIRLCRILEKFQLPESILWRFYKLTLAGAINRGFQEGRKYLLTKSN